MGEKIIKTIRERLKDANNLIYRSFYFYARQKEEFLINELRALELMPLVHKDYVLDMKDLDRIKNIRAQLALLGELNLVAKPNKDNE